MPVPALTLAAVEPKIHNITLKEPVDITVLDKLISSKLLKKSFHNPWAAKNFSTERKQLKAYKALIKAGCAEVKYSMVPGMSFGRSNPEKALGLFSIRRELRQTLAKGVMVDIDIENAHPTMLYQILKHHGIECDNLGDYVTNRAAYFDEVMTTYGVNREQAKKLFIELLFFGSFEKWAAEVGVFKEATKNIKNFKKEIQELGKLIKEKNPVIVAEIKKRKQKQKKTEYNETGSVVSYYLQEIERRILETIFVYCLSTGRIPNGKAVLCADGLMLLLECYDESLLTTFNELIKRDFGLDLRFTTKPFTQDYCAILDDNLLSESDIVKDELDGYDAAELVVDQEVDFSIKTLQELFEADVAELGAERYIEHFHFTKSFKYFDSYHAYFYLSNSVNKIYKSEISAYKDFMRSFDHIFVKVEKSSTRFTQLYNECKHKRIHSTFQFAPNKAIVDDKFNLFRGFKYSTADNSTYDPTVIQPFIDHLHYITKEDSLPPAAPHLLSDYMLNWFSHIIQKPEVKTKVALVLFSMTEGVGKNIISDIFSELLAGYSAKFRDTAALTDKFNVEMMGKLFVVGDEINARAQEVANELKDIITRTVEVIEPKGKDKMLLEDFKNYYFTTNNENVFKVSNTFRRFQFIECPEDKKGAEYYTALFGFLS